MADAEATGQIMQIQSAGLPGRRDPSPQSYQLWKGRRGIAGEDGGRVGRGWCRMVRHGQVEILVAKKYDN